MRRTAVTSFVAAVAAVLVATGSAGRTPSHIATPLRAECRSGYVDAVIGGEHKCLHAGKFCSAAAESDYERHGFTCVSGRLQQGAPTAPPPPRAPVSSKAVYDPPAPSRHAGCRVRGPLPDGRCTPGAVFATATVAQICVDGYSSSVRHVSEGTRHAAFAAYGIRAEPTGAYEVDHLISLELGGSNSIANLWPEAALPHPGFRDKDRLENRLHRLVCSGAISLRQAQRMIATNWLTAYRRFLSN
jgi:hypothetical protein